jgi:hypothetical protein
VKMLYLRMYRAGFSSLKLERLPELKRLVAEVLQPLLFPALQIPASVLGIAPESLRPLRGVRRSTLQSASYAIDGELYTDGETLVELAIYEQRRERPAQRGALVAASPLELYRIEVTAIGCRWEGTAVASVIPIVERLLEVRLESYVYTSQRFDELKAEGRESPVDVNPDEIRASEVLASKVNRILAIAIKASGGLLVKDAAKQLSPDIRDKSDEVIAELKTARLVDSEIVVVCSKTQSQVTRAANRELINELTLKGLKCACGRPLIEEQIEEAVTVTELGRGLLDKARWLTVLLIQELEAVGVSRDAILVEQMFGTDEIDCLANINGELVLFELKDKEFNLGSAYSFGAKIGIIRPRYPVIFTTEHVGNDAKEHFVRAGVSGVTRDRIYIDRADERDEISYIEGVENLKRGIEELVSRIHKADGIRLLNHVLPLATLNGEVLIDALRNKSNDQDSVTTDKASTA